MKIIRGQQYTDEWFAARRGVPTASEFDKIITPAKGKLSSSALPYACQLIGDLYNPMYGQQDEYVSAAMKNGTDTEPEARRAYELRVDQDVDEVCFVLSPCGRFGCSPDGLVGSDGVLELKCPQHATHVQYLLGRELPDKYKPQVHGHLIVTGREWCDFMSYAPGLPDLCVRVERDEYTERLRECLEEFWAILEETKSKLKLGDPPQAESRELTQDDMPAMLVH